MSDVKNMMIDDIINITGSQKNFMMFMRSLVENQEDAPEEVRELLLGEIDSHFGDVIDIIKETYNEIYTEEELFYLYKFIQTPLGASYTKKTSEVLPKVILPKMDEFSRKVLAPKFEKITEEYLKKENDIEHEDSPLSIANKEAQKGTISNGWTV